jgi:enamine deaminase RidA (YjgF/YER057c/UK114 family)
MKKELINPAQLPVPRGFNHGIVTEGGRLLFLSGQDASDANGRIISGDLVAQYEQVLQNLQAVVVEADGTMQDIVKLTIYVKDRDDYRAKLRELGRVHQKYFGAYYPTMALFEVTNFFQDGNLVELEGFAVLAGSE